MKMFPLQISRNASPGPRQIPWSVAEVAYNAYSAKYGSSQSLERLAERGGFGWCEMDIFYPGWRDAVDTSHQLRCINKILLDAVDIAPTCAICSGAGLVKQHDFDPDTRRVVAIGLVSCGSCEKFRNLKQLAMEKLNDLASLQGSAG
jgi:hypothetical protein